VDGPDRFGQSLLRRRGERRYRFHVTQGHVLAQTGWQGFQQASPAFAFGLVGFGHGRINAKVCREKQEAYWG
jgi:hypothetical protein